MVTATPFADAALDYFDRGYFPLPLPAGEKWPPPGRFTGGAGRYPNASQLVEWIAERPTGNIALRLSPDVVGVDVDHYRKGDKDKRGLDQLATLEAELGPLPPTMMSTSRTNGSGVRLFRIAPGISIGAIAADIDTIRSGHRYVVVSPSTNPDNDGAAYGWLHSLTGEELAEPWHVDELPPLPDAWVERFRSTNPAERTEGATSAEVVEFRAAHVERLDPRRLNGLRPLLDYARTTKGRHDSLVHVASEAAREAAAGAYPFVEAECVLYKWWSEVMAGEPGRLDPRKNGTTEFDDAIAWAIGQANGSPERIAEKRKAITYEPLEATVRAWTPTAGNDTKGVPGR